MNDKTQEELDKLAKEIGAVAYAAQKLHEHKNVIGGIDTSFNIISMINPKAGSVKYKNSKGEVLICEPGTPLFSTATMTAFEWWDGENWKTFGVLD